MTTTSLNGFGFQSLQPSDLDGDTQPPAESPNYYIRHRDDEVHNPGSNDPSRDFLELFEFRVDFANPANSTLTGPFRIPIAEIDSELCGLVSFSCFPQPAGGPALDPLREVVMWRLQYRNFESHEALMGSLVTDVNGDDQGGIRWFELRRRDGGSWELFQEGTYAPDEHNRWMSSIAMDKAGNIAVGYSVGSDALSAGLRYAGRLAADPPGTLPQTEVTLVDGVGSSNSIRWGDYSSMNVDPVDDCTFWYTHQYAQNGLYSTRIGSFAFDEACGRQQEGLRSYSAKFVCGRSGQDEKAIRGNYATTVNVHNPGSVLARFAKKAVIPLSQREPRGRISEFVDEILEPDEAVGVDCTDIRKLLSLPTGFIEGFLVLHVPVEMPELDVVGVYTAGGNRAESIHLETVHPKTIRGGVQGKPDLVPVPDENGSFCRRTDDGRLIVTVRNQGAVLSGESVTEVDFHAHGALSQSTVSIDTGGSEDLFFRIPSGCFDSDCEFRITVDKNTQVDESNETNNTGSDTCLG